MLMLPTLAVDLSGSVLGQVALTVPALWYLEHFPLCLGKSEVFLSLLLPQTMALFHPLSFSYEIKTQCVKFCLIVSLFGVAYGATG